MVASFSSLLVNGGAARSDRCRRRSGLTVVAMWPWLRPWRARLCSGHFQSGPPLGQSMQRTSSPRWLKPYWSGIARSRRQREPGHGWPLQFAVAVEELAELLADLAAAGVAFLPLVRVDAQGGVGFAVAEPPLHVDDGNVERDQHAGMAVTQVVQARLGRCQPRGFDGPLERLARDLAHEPAAVSAREHERAGVGERAPFGDKRDQPPHQLGWDVDRPPRLRRLQLAAVAVAVELVLDPDQRVRLVEVANGEPERLTDPHTGGDEQFEQAAVLLAVGVGDQRFHLVEAEDPLRPLVVELGPFAAFELAARVDRDRTAPGGVAEDQRQRLQRAGGA